MRRGLSVEDLGDLLERPLVAALSTRRPDGSVLLSPVWHEWRDGGFSVWTGSDDVKVRHLRRDPSATILVAESDLPYRGIEVRTEARVLTDGVEAAARRIAARYIGAARGDAYVDSGGGDDVILRLEPGALRAWDFADDWGEG
ncbi:MAG TPA: TIGR03618 family F420-dependent PPOX class oxidoreductase [Actinomycetota bacterium]|jgi:PPOX class probable F420-dependent enzyme